MLRGSYMAGLACICAVSTVMTSTAYAATTTYDMRKKAVSLLGIMNEGSRNLTVARGEFSRMLVNASEYAAVTGTTSNVSVYADVKTIERQPEWTDDQFDKLNLMQEYINDIIWQLNENSSFTPAGK